MDPTAELIHLAVSIASWPSHREDANRLFGTPLRLYNCDVMLAGVSQEHFTDHKTNEQLAVLTRHQLPGSV